MLSNETLATITRLTEQIRENAARRAVLAAEYERHMAAASAAIERMKAYDECQCCRRRRRWF